MAKLPKRTVGLIDGPSPYATLQTWERHLADLKKLPADALGKPQMMQAAREMIEKKKKKAATAA